MRDILDSPAYKWKHPFEEGWNRGNIVGRDV